MEGDYVYRKQQQARRSLYKYGHNILSSSEWNTATLFS